MNWRGGGLGVRGRDILGGVGGGFGSGLLLVGMYCRYWCNLRFSISCLHHGTSCDLLVSG